MLDPLRTNEHHSSTKSIALWMLAATMLAAALRLHQLDDGSFWLDELFTIKASSQLSEMHHSKRLGYLPTVIGLNLAGIDPSTIPQEPAQWRGMGLTESVVRLPTAILGIATIPIVGLASIRLLGARAAIIVALLLAIAPWHIYWSQAARFYIPQFLFFTLSVIYYFIATRSQCRRSFVTAMVCMVLAFLSQPTALLLLAIFGADWLVSYIRRRPVPLGPFEWTAGAFAALLCVGIAAYDVWLAPSSWTHFLEDGVRHQSPVRMILGAVYMIVPAMFVFALIAAVGLWARDARLAVYLAAAAIIPILTFAAMSAWAFVGLRYSFVALYGWLALTAVGTVLMYDVLRPRLGTAVAWSPLAVLVASLGMANYIYYNSNGNFHARWREAAEYVRTHRQPGEQVAASDVITAEFYMQEPVSPLPGSIEAVQGLREPTWFIVEVTYAGRSTGRFWLFPDADLREVFALRVAHMTSSVQVYKREPDQ